MSNHEEMLNGMEKLLYAVIASAVKERDIKYFHGITFEGHCRLLNVDPMEVRQRAVRQILKH